MILKLCPMFLNYSFSFFSLHRPSPISVYAQPKTNLQIDMSKSFDIYVYECIRRVRPLGVQFMVQLPRTKHEVMGLLLSNFGESQSNGHLQIHNSTNTNLYDRNAERQKLSTFSNWGFYMYFYVTWQVSRMASYYHHF